MCDKLKSIHLSVGLISEAGMQACNEAIVTGPCGD